MVVSKVTGLVGQALITLRVDLAGQTVQLHEALGEGLVEGVTLVVGSQVEVVKGLVRTTTVHIDVAAVHNQTDITGDVLLGLVDEGIEGFLQRAVPETVVDQFSPAVFDAVLEAGKFCLLYTSPSPRD